MSDVVECLLAGSSQNSKAIKTFEAGAFVFWQRRRHGRPQQSLEPQSPETLYNPKQAVRYARESEQMKTRARVG
jgi:hypothetical protein